MIEIPKYNFKNTTDVQERYDDFKNFNKHIQRCFADNLLEIEDIMLTAAEKFGKGTQAHLRSEMMNTIINYWGSMYKDTNGAISRGECIINLANIIDCLNKKDYDGMYALIEKLPFGDSNTGDELADLTLHFTLWFMTKEEQEENKEKFVKYIDKAFHGKQDANKLFETYASGKQFKKFVEYVNSLHPQKK